MLLRNLCAKVGIFLVSANFFCFFSVITSKIIDEAHIYSDFETCAGQEDRTQTRY